MVSQVELAALIVLGGSIAAYAVGGMMHILIDYIHGKRLLRTYWDATDKKIAGIEDQVVAKLEERLGGQDADGQTVAKGLSSFLHSEDGVQWARELANLTANQANAQITGAIGGIKRTDQRRLAVNLARLDWGNPWLNAAWNEVVRREPERLNKIAKQIMESGMLEGPALEGQATAAQEAMGPEWR
jgi:hypothetical protein